MALESDKSLWRCPLCDPGRLRHWATVSWASWVSGVTEPRYPNLVLLHPGMSQVLTFKLEAPNLAKDRVSILPNYLSFLFTVSMALVACSCSKGKPRAKVFARSTSSDSRFKEDSRIFRQWYLKSPFVLHYIEKYLFICHRFISDPTRTDKSFGFRLGTWTAICDCTCSLCTLEAALSEGWSWIGRGLQRPPPHR